MLASIPTQHTNTPTAATRPTRTISPNARNHWRWTVFKLVTIASQKPICLSTISGNTKAIPTDK